MIKLKKFTLKEKSLFEDHLFRCPHRLSAYSFIYVYIWKSFFKFQYCVIKNCFCLFAKDKYGMFLYIEPLGKINKQTIDLCFQIMDSHNRNKKFSRIENVENTNLSIYKDFGYRAFLKSIDYIYDRASLASLKGDYLKHKRSNVNYFLKNSSFNIVNYKNSFFRDCTQLYKDWAYRRSLKHTDTIYKDMLKQSYTAFKIALKDSRKLDLVVKLVLIDSQVRGCTIGFPLNRQTFCVVFEITDLAIKGLAQFLFKSFAQGASQFKYINAMDDSGLKNIKAVKLSYKPIELLESFNVTS